VSTPRYAKIEARVDRLHERHLPMQVIFQTVYPGEPWPEPMPHDPSRMTVKIITRYLSREETEADMPRRPSRSQIKG
jgi:hypothetical protein